ncbi:MAG: hypothetical protein NO115_01840 [Sulfolobales archaeon]|nr:hypothetical protein [Sulfolobales archaeon]
MDLQDKITVMRGVLGCVVGVLSVLTLSLSIPLAFALPIVGYGTSAVIARLLGAQSKWDLYLRATYVYFAAWLLILLVVYNLFQ